MAATVRAILDTAAEAVPLVAVAVVMATETVATAEIEVTVAMIETMEAETVTTAEGGAGETVETGVIGSRTSVRNITNPLQHQFKVQVLV